MELIDKIRDLAPFSGLSREQLLRLLAGARLEEYAPATALFDRHEMPRYLHVLLAGKVKLWIHHQGNTRVLHDVLAPGEIFLLPAVITDMPYPLGAAAINSIQVLLLPAERVRKTITASNRLATFFLDQLSSRYQADQQKCLEMRTLNTAQRLARFLLRLEREQNQDMITLPYSKRLLAAQLHMTPESLSRAFARLRPHITCLDDSRIRIVNEEALERYCNSGV